jgi:5-methyltetrahydrofolate--homocysteine methyltransferase
MLPAASVSGFFLAHPEARYFAVGKIGDDQLADLAARSGRPVDVLRRDLAPNL